MTNKNFNLDVEYVYDIAWTLDLPTMIANLGWAESDNSQRLSSYVGAEVLGYLNFTVAAEFFEQTQQRVTVGLIPFRVYPAIDYFKMDRNMDTDQVHFINKLRAYVSLGEIHTYYYSNWKACGNVFMNADGSSNLDDTFVDKYCAYNANTATEVYDYDEFFPDLRGPRYTRNFKLWTYDEWWN